ncbi:histidine kinase [uncultured Christiangramia sp.]|uniref:sensor histidine kinase n=1 Tax=Christiangramia sp. 3-2217-3z TaxID=3417564 RepID=UPI002605274A|nr:histidine kinase [uncultured Christiangramia sp.]
MLRKEEIILILYFILVIVLLTVFIVFFVITYQKRKNKILQEKFEAEQQFLIELNNTKIEIQEATLKNVSWELHDNIGQLLSVASIQLNILLKRSKEDAAPAVTEIKDLVANSLNEVRSLSRTLNNEVIHTTGLHKSVRDELERYNRMDILQAELEIKGEAREIRPESEIIIFRIMQEFFNNVIKYAEASSLEVQLNYLEDSLQIHARDNGKGFDDTEVEKGSGIINMYSRARLINAKIDIQSKVGEGTSLKLNYPIQITSNV